MHGPADAPARLIKRYANRKLYDPSESCYVTLQDIEALVQAGVDVRVVDNRTGEDVTRTTLAQILCGAGRRSDPRYPLPSLLAIFRRPEIEEKVRELLRLGEETRDDAEQAIRELLAAPQRAVDELQRRIDDRVGQVLRDLAPLRKIDGDVKALAERVAKLERRSAGTRGRDRKKRG